MCALLCSPLVFESQNSLFASVKEAYQSTKGQTIKGVIVDQDNEPIIGASIFVEGTSKGVTTDLDGNYQ
ncbi:MAG: carboxypeptidase-like regulatory domain-containing protein, partial [Bacteroidales bacterium]